MESLEHPTHLIGRYPLAGVLDREPDARAGTVNGDVPTPRR
jgi:hypothetical protein